MRLEPNGISVFIRRDTKDLTPCHVPYEDTVRKQPSASQEEGSHQGICRHLDLGLSASRTVSSKFLLFKLLSLFYFVMAARAKTPMLRKQ